MKPIERLLQKLERDSIKLAWILLVAMGFVLMLSGLILGQGEM